jgi:hypothetical protein
VRYEGEMSSQDFESGLNPLDSWIMAQSNLQKSGTKQLQANKGHGVRHNHTKPNSNRCKPEGTNLLDLNKQFGNLKENKNQNTDNFFKSTKSKMEGNDNWEEGFMENSKKNSTVGPKIIERRSK